MADITITAANVVAGSNAKKTTGTAGATITAGQVVYLDSADSKYKLADNDSGTAALRSPVGIALHGASNGQPLTIQTAGLCTIGGTIAAGVIYCLSSTPGGICPSADLATGDYTTTIGIGNTIAILDVKLHESGVVIA